MITIENQSRCEESSMNKRSLYRSFFALFFPLVFQNIITISVNLADNMMLGAYSEAALSGVSSVNQIQFVLQQVMMALGDGAVMFASQYWGKRETDPIRGVASTALWSSMVISAALFVVVSVFPRRMLLLFTDSEPIIEQGMIYLNIIRFSYLIFSVTLMLLAILRSVEIVKIAFRLSLMTLVVNCGINYVLIYGRFGFPELGVAGAAIGTLTARILECAAAFYYVLRVQKVMSFSFRQLFLPDRAMAGRYIRKVFPNVLIKSSWGFNVALQTMILGHMTAAAIAANSAASTLYLLSKSAAVGAASATATLIGKTIGQGDIDKVHWTAKQMQKLFLVIGFCAAMFLFFIRIPVLKFYKLSPEALELANSFLLVLCFVCFTMSYQMPTNSGIIKGGGDVNFVVKMDFISIWCITVPLSLFMAFVVGASPVVVVCCLNADQVFKCIPAFLHARGGKWVKKLT